MRYPRGVGGGAAVSAELVKCYRALLTELLFEREAQGGELPEEAESHFVERLDGLWWQLSAEEQAAIDRELQSGVAVSVSEEPRLVDCKVAKGAKALPRRAA